MATKTKKTTAKKTTAKRSAAKKTESVESVTLENLPDKLRELAIRATGEAAELILAAGLVPISGQTWATCPISGKQDGSLKNRIAARRSLHIAEIAPEATYLNTAQRAIVQPWATANSLVSAARLKIVNARKAEQARKNRADTASTDTAAREMLAGMARTLASHIGNEAASAMLTMQGISPADAESMLAD